MPICVANFYFFFQLLLPPLFSSHEYSGYSLFKDYNDHSLWGQHLQTCFLFFQSSACPETEQKSSKIRFAWLQQSSGLWELSGCSQHSLSQSCKHREEKVVQFLKYNLDNEKKYLETAVKARVMRSAYSPVSLGTGRHKPPKFYPCHCIEAFT